MTDNEKNEFLAKVMQHMDGCLDSEGIRELELEMKESDEKRELFSETYLVGSSLQDHMANMKTSEAKTKKVFVFSPWLRTAAVLVFGVIIGISSMTVANAFSKNQSLFTAIGKLFESFEEPPEPESKGIPQQTLFWGGDSSKVTFADQQIVPPDGKKMLRFLKADYPGKPIPGGYLSEIYRWVDLNEFNFDRSSENLDIVVSALFNATEKQAKEGLSSSLGIFAYESIPPELAPTYNVEDLTKTCFALTDRKIKSIDSDPKSWEKIKVNMPIPLKAKFILIRISAYRHDVKQISPELVFPGAYVDDIKISFIKTAPGKP